MNPNLAELRKKSMALPLEPGVYIMKNKSGQIIYIGKAKKLKNRVSSYFGSDKQHTLKVKKMVDQVNDFDYIICDTELEALLLECSLIKQHSPKYNILLKDDKGYHYIKITSGDWPMISEVKQKLNDKAEYLGPYNSGWILKQTVDEAQKIFGLPRCSKQFPRDIGKSRPCLNHHLGLCSAPCSGKIKQKDYLESVKSAVEFIKGGSANTAAKLQKQMEKAAENLEFELAAKLRDRIKALSRASERQKVITTSYKEQDVIASARTETALCFAVMCFRAGHLTDMNCFVITTPDELVLDRTEFLERYYSNTLEIPKRIVLDGDVTNLELLSEWLSEKAERKVEIVIPKIGEQLNLVKMCAFNAAEHLAKIEQRQTHETAALDELARLLSLPSPPSYIEAYDISHTMGNENVAGMTVFENGKPLKSAYKRFRIKSFEGQDDYRSMAEVLDRRFTEYESAQEKGESDGFGRLPDLILLDGGQGQLGAVLPVMQKHSISVPVFGMVKDSKHRTRAITAGGGDISIKANQRAYVLIATIQEETHRFAITYHRNSSRKKGLTAELSLVEGMGDKRIKVLLKKFKSISKIKEATAEEIKIATGFPIKVCQNIYDFYH
ncbi:MAG: excinuclease ABC subunit UvrC [Clostridia bacterium]|nr:excinuclease ABC subunit UvrC [Clostridia bacterium]